MSPSSRGRGLKLCIRHHHHLYNSVALFTRAWIEIKGGIATCRYSVVALFTRAWIEIPRSRGKTTNLMSPSSRGRGLKYFPKFANPYLH